MQFSPSPCITEHPTHASHRYGPRPPRCHDQQTNKRKGGCESCRGSTPVGANSADGRHGRTFRPIGACRLAPSHLDLTASAHHRAIPAPITHDETPDDCTRRARRADPDPISAISTLLQPRASCTATFHESEPRSSDLISVPPIIMNGFSMSECVGVEVQLPKPCGGTRLRV
jgi:hypothetical protein